MKTALLLSGHIRNLVENYDNLKEHVLNHFQPDVFLHTWDTYGWRAEGNDIECGDGKFKGFDYYSGKVNQEEIVSLLNPKAYVFENFLEKEEEFLSQAKKYKSNCKHPKDRPENVVGLAYKIFKCNELKKLHEQNNNFVYDVVIRARPDIVYSEWFNKRILSLVGSIENNTLFTPVEESYGNASDILAVGSSSTIDLLSTLYLCLEQLNTEGANMNPHHLLKMFLDQKFEPTKWFKLSFGIDLNRCRKKNLCGGNLWCNSCDPSKKILSNISSE